MPNGIPMIVQQKIIPATTEPIQSQMPAKITQITFSKNAQAPALSLGTMSFPKGKNANIAILNDATPYGIPMIVQQNTSPVTIHASPISSPKNRNQITFPINDITLPLYLLVFTALRIASSATKARHQPTPQTPLANERETAEEAAHEVRKHTSRAPQASFPKAVALQQHKAIPST